MKLPVTPLLLSLPFLLGAAPAPNDLRNDIRCFMVASELGGSNDQSERTAGLLASEYYLGRIDGRAPGLNLEAAMMRELPISDTDRASLLRSCGARLQARGAAVQAIGE